MGIPARRSQRERGATLVEYSLIFAFLVVIAVGSLQYLTTQAEEQVANQADCVATRPPPPACQVPALDTTTTLVGSPTTAPPVTIPGGGTASWTTPLTSVGTTVSGTLTVGMSGTPIPDALVWYSVTCNPGGSTFYLDPVNTDANGMAPLTASCPTGSTSAVITAYRIDSEPTVDTLPSSVTVTLT